MEQFGPRPLASSAKELSSLATDSWIALLNAYWEHGGRFDQQIGAFAQFLPRAFLQPYAEYLASQMPVPPPQTTSRVCPLCGARSLLGVLRPEGDGGKRCLVCSFCGQEWDFRRLVCATCGEEEEKKLPVYVAEQFPHIRVESCDTCKFFLRSIDLTKDGHAIPLVDDLAAIHFRCGLSSRATLGFSRISSAPDSFRAKMLRCQPLSQFRSGGTLEGAGFDGLAAGVAVGLFAAA